MTEFTIAVAFVLIPLFLILPFLGKFMDMKATSIQAARYAAWERTVWYGNSDWAAGQKSDAQIQAEVQKRFLSDSPDQVFSSNDMTAGGALGDKALWRDHTGESILAGNSTGSGNGQTPGTMDAILNGVTTAVNWVGAALGTNFKLDMKSLYTSTVTLQAAKTDAMGRAWGDTNVVAPSFAMTQVMVTNGWSANGPDFVKKQTEALAPLSLGQRSPIDTIFSGIQTVAGLFLEELKPSSLKMGGVIAPDQVPPDRLSGAPPAAAPKKTLQERQAADETEKTKAQTDRVFEGVPGYDNAVPKTNALNKDISSTQAQINQCGAAKQAEAAANTKIVCKKVDSCSVNTGQAGCKVDTTVDSCGVPPPPPPPLGDGKSYTPIYDANPACNIGIDQKIKDLKAQLADPVLQQAKKRSDDALAATPSLKDQPGWMADRASVYKVLNDWQAQIDQLEAIQKQTRDKQYVP